MTQLSFHRVRVASGDEDRGGLLAMIDGELAALFTCLDADYHGDQRGAWHHEFGFGRHDGRPGVFASLAEVTRWMLERADLTENDLDAAPTVTDLPVAGVTDGEPREA